MGSAGTPGTRRARGASGRAPGAAHYPSIQLGSDGNAGLSGPAARRRRGPMSCRNRVRPIMRIRPRTEDAMPQPAEKQDSAPTILKDAAFVWEDPLDIEHDLTEEERMCATR